MQQYAQVRGLPRVILPLPILAPSLAALWVGLVTPIPNCLAVPLVQGMVKDVVGDLTRARALFPEIQPMDYKASVALALHRIHEGNIKTSWSGAVLGEEGVTFEDTEGLVREVRVRILDVPVEAVYRAFTSLGGEQGWLACSCRWSWS